jgi:hypothetical protein
MHFMLHNLNGATWHRVYVERLKYGTPVVSVLISERVNPECENMIKEVVVDYFKIVYLLWEKKAIDI